MSMIEYLESILHEKDEMELLTEEPAFAFLLEERKDP